MPKNKKIETATDNREIRIGEIRAVDVDDKMIIEGYALTFDKASTQFGFTEVIASGALDETDMKDVPLRYNHKEEYLIIARTRNKSLTLEKDDKGLRIRAELIDTTTNRDLYKSIQAKLVDKMSFRFTVAPGGEDWDWDKYKRTVTKIDKLYDVSVVDTPFYDDTSIYARALSELESHKETLDNDKKLALEVEKLKFNIKSKA